MSVIFLNSHRGKSGTLNGQKLPPDYVLACKFFDCGIIDRTSSLELGFDAKVLDPIPGPELAAGQSFGQISEAVAKDIWALASQQNRPIQVLWSGGIDSTVALIALVNTCPDESMAARLEVLLSMESINEYPLFFKDFILRKLSYRMIHPPITKHFSEEAIIVTGEHGDQLFGSDKLLPLIVNQLAFEDYQTIMPLYLIDKLGNQPKAERLMQYIAPLIDACPLPIVSTFDLFWWLNFTIKWQQVSLRLPVFAFQNHLKDIADRFQHFFRDPRFQSWSLNNHSNRASPNLATYKLPAKEYIFDYTKDAEYLLKKSKEPSLKHVIIDRKTQGQKRYRVHVDDNYQAVVEVFHKNFKNKTIV